MNKPTPPPDGGPAFPGGYPPAGSPIDTPAPVGMSLRQYIATAALQGILADPERGGSHAAYAKEAVEYADAIIAELSKEEA